MPDNVVVFGGTSYVGQRTVKALVDAGYHVDAVVRRPSIARILLGDLGDQIGLVSADAIERTPGRGARAVVNLAYARDAAAYEAYRQTRNLIRKVQEAARASRGERIIHISTQAVFGYNFERRPAPAEVHWWPAADPYVETKVYAEQLLAKASRHGGYDLAIVRLGNVIGPAAPNWVASLAQRMLDGKAVGYESRLGYANATYVDNVASYVCELVRRPPADLNEFGVYHHLAEFSAHSWREILDCIAGAVGNRYVLVDRGEDGGGSPAASIARAMLASLYRGRAGGYARAVMERVDPRRGAVGQAVLRLSDLKRTARLAPPELGPSDAQICSILSAQVRFESRTLPGWHPPVSFDEARTAIADWLTSAGYALDAAGARWAEPPTNRSPLAPHLSCVDGATTS